MVPPETLATIKATLPFLRSRGVELTSNMYDILFRDPEVKAMFDASHQGSGSQQAALAQSVLAYAEHIQDPRPMAPMVERIAQRHVSLGVHPSHYPKVGAALLQAMREMLAGNEGADKIVAAWAEAYGALAGVFISREDTIVHDVASAKGGWSGWRPLRVEKVVRESDMIASIHLAAADGRPLAAFEPGQYLTVRPDIPGYGPVVRTYSFSHRYRPGRYRLSVKREDGCATHAKTPAGLVSNYLHTRIKPGDEILCRPPNGTFKLASLDRPIVLLSGGVGLTPLMSMLETIAAKNPALSTWWVHGALDGSNHAMRSRVRSLSKRHPAFQTLTVYEKPGPKDIRGRDFDQSGFITSSMLRSAILDIATRDVYLCGPKPFMKAMAAALFDLGLPKSNLRYEMFGPDDLLIGETAA